MRRLGYERQHFQELSTGVYDELMRRKNNTTDNEVPVVPQNLKREFRFTSAETIWSSHRKSECAPEGTFVATITVAILEEPSFRSCQLGWTATYEAQPCRQGMPYGSCQIFSTCHKADVQTCFMSYHMPTRLTRRDNGCLNFREISVENPWPLAEVFRGPRNKYATPLRCCGGGGGETNVRRSSLEAGTVEPCSRDHDHMLKLYS
ncbi:hypothetical protein C2E23DRAFT_244531 [Lenzites betulinus]|nr:hypothetical protein C2E23DRAFT_244531 [Lenzites betulinus]